MQKSGSMRIVIGIANRQTAAFTAARLHRAAIINDNGANIAVLTVADTRGVNFTRGIYIGSRNLYRAAGAAFTAADAGTIRTAVSFHG